MKQTNVPALLVLVNPIVLEFVAGMLIAKMALSKTWPMNVSLLTIITGSTLVLFLKPIFPQAPELLTRGIPAVLLVAGMAMADPYLRPVPAFLLLLGASSYALYLFHPIFAPAVPFIFAKLAIDGSEVAFATSVAGAVVVGIFIYRVIEQPTLKLSNVIPRIQVPDAGGR
jgi:peptidoglycan/LPS O-acetylase OafA/YrhL